MKSSAFSKILMASGAFCMLLGILSGAFGAHALKNALPGNLLAAFQTGVNYQIYHGLGLIIVGIAITLQISGKWLYWSGLVMAAGLLLFSGSLYALALTGVRWFGFITPFGGILLMLSWLLFAIGILRKS